MPNAALDDDYIILSVYGLHSCGAFAIPNHASVLWDNYKVRLQGVGRSSDDIALGV